MVGAFSAASEKIVYENVTVAVAETGWPSAGSGPYKIVGSWNEKWDAKKTRESDGDIFL